MAEHISPLWSAIKADIVPKSGFHTLESGEEYEVLRNEIGVCLESCIFSLNKVGKLPLIFRIFYHHKIFKVGNVIQTLWN